VLPPDTQFNPGLLSNEEATLRPNRDDDAVAIMLRFLLAATLATALCLAPVAIQQAKGLFFLGN
jgi:hypothetical protein